MPSPKTACRAPQVPSGSESERKRMYPGSVPPCVLYKSISLPPPVGMIRPPGRWLNVSRLVCAEKVRPPSVLTEMTMVKVPSELRRCAQHQMRSRESTAIMARWYAVEDELESNTLTAAAGDQSPAP